MTSSTQKPKIIHIVEAFGGGVFQSVRQLCEGIPDAEVIVIHSIREETPSNFAKQYPTHVRFIYLPMQRAISPKKDIKALFQLRSLIKQEAPNAVHAHSSKAGALARLALIGLNTKIIYSPRGYSFLMEDASTLKRAVYWTLERILGTLPGTTISCGYDELHAAKMVSLKALCIPNSIDADTTPKEQRNRPKWDEKTPLQVVSSGRISPQKNFKAICEVASAFQNSPIEFTWVGGGKTDEYNIPPNLHITGWLNHSDAQKHLQKGHVFLHLSLWEGLSRVMLECMAMGFPLVASNVPGNRELVSNNNGFLCKNSSDAIKALHKILKEPDLLTQMGKASRQLLEEHYNWSVNLQKWKMLYEK